MDADSEAATKTRRSRAELKELVLEAAVELLQRNGIEVEPVSITYKSVFEHLEATRGIKITRGSVHERIWDSQQEFQLETLERAAVYGITGFDAALEPALEALEAARAIDAPVWERCEAVVRAAAQAAQEASEADGRYHSWVGLTLALASSPSLTDEQARALRESVRKSYALMTEELTANYRTLTSAMGLRMRTDLFLTEDEGWDVLTRLGTALSEGASLRTRFDKSELPVSLMATGGESAYEEWHPFAIGVLALLRFFMEEDDSEARDS